MTKSQADSKVELRREIIGRIVAISREVRLDQDQALTRQFVAIPGLEESQMVLLYLSAFAEEIPTRDLCASIRSMGKTLILPRVSRNPRRLRLFEVSDFDKDLSVSPFGISEPRLDLPEVPPESVDWAMIPALAFDPQGYRLGRGGGYYDRLLPQLRPDAICWGLGYDCQLVAEIPREDHDAPLNGVTTPSRTIDGLRGLHPHQ